MLQQSYDDLLLEDSEVAPDLAMSIETDDEKETVSAFQSSKLAENLSDFQQPDSGNCKERKELETKVQVLETKVQEQGAWKLEAQRQIEDLSRLTESLWQHLDCLWRQAEVFRTNIQENEAWKLEMQRQLEELTRGRKGQETQGKKRRCSEDLEATSRPSKKQKQIKNWVKEYQKQIENMVWNERKVMELFDHTERGGLAMTVDFERDDIFRNPNDNAVFGSFQPKSGGPSKPSNSSNWVYLHEDSGLGLEEIKATTGTLARYKSKKKYVNVNQVNIYLRDKSGALVRSVHYKGDLWFGLWDYRSEGGLSPRISSVGDVWRVHCQYGGDSAATENGHMELD